MEHKEGSGSLRPVAESAKLQSFINQVLDDLEILEVERALKIPLSDWPDSGANILTLLHSTARKKGIGLEARADGDFLYVWNARLKSGPS
jgi:hypothetical protein